MGVVNVTPDSFSDGGLHLQTGAAISHGLRLADAGADIVDVGGESTRPGAAPVAASEEAARVVPVVAALADAGIVVSIDTSKPVVAAAAIDAGAAIVNDVTALADPAMAGVVADSGAGLVLMHMQGTPRTMQVDPHYDDVVSEVRDHLLERAATAEAAGIPRQRICLDPGIGFGKLLEHNLELLRRLDVLVGCGYPVMVGTSRKAFLGSLTGGLPPEDRDEVTGATVALAIDRGAAVVRVHNVAVTARMARVVDAIVRNRDDGGG